MAQGDASHGCQVDGTAITARCEVTVTLPRRSGCCAPRSCRHGMWRGGARMPSPCELLRNIHRCSHVAHPFACNGRTYVGSGVPKPASRSIRCCGVWGVRCSRFGCGLAPLTRWCGVRRARGAGPPLSNSPEAWASKWFAARPDGVNDQHRRAGKRGSQCGRATASVCALHVGLHHQ